jgi:hypothetical protein
MIYQIEKRQCDNCGKVVVRDPEERAKTRDLSQAFVGWYKASFVPSSVGLAMSFGNDFSRTAFDFCCRQCLVEHFTKE